MSSQHLSSSRDNSGAGTPPVSEVPLKSHVVVSQVQAKGMNVEVPRDAIDYNQRRHEAGFAPKFRYPTPAGWGHRIVVSDSATNKYPPNYTGKLNDLDLTGGVVLPPEDDNDHPEDSLHKDNVGVWNRAAAVRKTSSWQPVASHPLNQTSAGGLSAYPSHGSRSLLDTPTTNKDQTPAKHNILNSTYYSKPTTRSLATELETPYARQVRATTPNPCASRSINRSVTFNESSGDKTQVFTPRGGQSFYAMPGLVDPTVNKSSSVFINSPNPLLNGSTQQQRQVSFNANSTARSIGGSFGDTSTMMNNSGGNVSVRELTTKPLTGSQGRVIGTPDDNPFTQRRKKQWAAKVGASAHLRSVNLTTNDDDSDSGNEEYVTAKSYNKRRGLSTNSPHYRSGHSYAVGGPSRPLLSGEGPDGLNNPSFVPAYLHDTTAEHQANQGQPQSVHDRLMQEVDDQIRREVDGDMSPTSRGLLSPNSTSREVVASHPTRGQVEVATGVPRFTMAAPPPHPDEEAEYRLRGDMSKWHWKYEEGYQVPFSLLLTRGIRPKAHMSIVNHHMVRELIVDCRKLMFGDYLVRYSRKGGVPHERFVALVMHPPKQGDEPIPMLLWRQHQNSSQILDRNVLCNLVGVSFDSHSKAFKPFKVYPEKGGHNPSAAYRGDTSRQSRNSGSRTGSRHGGSQRGGGSQRDDRDDDGENADGETDSMATLDSTGGGPQALWIDGPMMGGSKRMKMSPQNVFTLWFWDPVARSAKSVDVAARTQDQASLWVKVMRGLLAINNVCIGEYQAEEQQKIVEWVRTELEGRDARHEQDMFETDVDFNAYM